MNAHHGYRLEERNRSKLLGVLLIVLTLDLLFSAELPEGACCWHGVYEGASKVDQTQGHHLLVGIHGLTSSYI
jgi:hypothetical protein